MINRILFFTFLFYYLCSPAYSSEPITEKKSVIKAQYILEVMSIPFINAFNIQYPLTENIALGAGTSLNFLRFPDERKQSPIIINATYYLSNLNGSSWYVRTLFLQGYPLFDLGYRWSFDSWTLGLGSTYVYGPSFTSGQDFTGFIGASVGVKL